MNDDRDLIDNENETQNEVSQSSSLNAPVFNSAKDAIVRYSHCIMCGANLHFVHQTDFSRNLTLETAKCPECGVRARSVTHRLQ